MFLQNAQLSLCVKIVCCLFYCVFIYSIIWLSTDTFTLRIIHISATLPQFTRRLIDDLIHAHIKSEFLLFVLLSRNYFIRVSI